MGRGEHVQTVCSAKVSSVNTGSYVHLYEDVPKKIGAPATETCAPLGVRTPSDRRRCENLPPPIKKTQTK
jgi:hypothetical protein